MIVRPAISTDKVQLADILNQIIAIGGTTAYENPLDPSYFDRLICAPDPKIFLTVAETEDGLQGFQWMEPFDPPDTHIGGIATFARPETKQRGVGTALFSKTRELSRQAGYDILVAKIRADNSGGLAYYAKMGFTDHEISRGEPLKDGTPVDRIHKRLTL